MEVGGALRGVGSETEGDAQDPGKGLGVLSVGLGPSGAGVRGVALGPEGAPSGRSCNQVSGNAATSAAAASGAALNLEQPPLGVLEISRKALLGLPLFLSSELHPSQEGPRRRGTALPLAGIVLASSPTLPVPVLCQGLTHWV